jgi:hypothetical protein
MFGALREFDIAPIAYGPGLILHENPGYRSAVNRGGEVTEPKVICPNDETYVNRLIGDSTSSLNQEKGVTNSMAKTKKEVLMFSMGVIYDNNNAVSIRPGVTFRFR